MTGTIGIPFSLARLLVAKREDVKDYEYEDIQDLAKALLAVLIAAHDDITVGALTSRKRKVKAVKVTTIRKRKRTLKERKAQSRRMKAIWKSRKQAATND